MVDKDCKTCEVRLEANKYIAEVEEAGKNYRKLIRRAKDFPELLEIMALPRTPATEILLREEDFDFDLVPKLYKKLAQKEREIKDLKSILAERH